MKMKNLITWILLAVGTGSIGMSIAVSDTTLEDRKKNFKYDSEFGTLSPKRELVLESRLKEQKIWKNWSNIQNQMRDLAKPINRRCKRNTTCEVENDLVRSLSTVATSIKNVLPIEDYASKISIANFNKNSEENSDHKNGINFAGDDADGLRNILTEMTTERMDDDGDSISNTLKILQNEKLLEIQRVIYNIEQLNLELSSHTTHSRMEDIKLLQIDSEPKVTSHDGQNKQMNEKLLRKNAVSKKLDTFEAKPTVLKLLEEENKRKRKYLRGLKNIIQDFSMDEDIQIKSLKHNQRNQIKPKYFKSEQTQKALENHLQSIQEQLPKEEHYFKSNPMSLKKSVARSIQNGTEQREVSDRKEKAETENAEKDQAMYEKNLLLLIGLICIFFCCMINALLCFFLHLRQHMGR